jgi:hypothetical protein
MSAEQIAKVIADMRNGRVRPLGPGKDRVRNVHDKRIHELALQLVMHPVVVDATAIYHSLVAKDEPIHMYEDHPCIAPPWEEAAICYENEHGNVIVMHASVMPFDPEKPPWDDMADTHTIDWGRVKWRVDTFVWLGGRSKIQGGAFGTSGPVHMWQFAIYADGEPADLHWVHLTPEYEMKSWDMAHLVLLGALNFMNCRNVALVEPKRERHEAKRIARTGVSVHTINVFPTGVSARSAAEKGESTGTPLTSVRGHFACYGPEYDRGLLFGKYAGRFWIAPHARGSTEFGENVTDYKLRP